MTLATVQSTHQSTILVVDDDEDVRQIIQVMLEHAGYCCLTRSEPEAALALLARTAVDLVVTDLCFTGQHRTGLEIIDFIRQRDDAVPTILITAFPSIGRAVEAMKRGAVDFLSKPFDRDMLLHQVGKALQERRLRVENRRLLAEVNKTAVIEKLNRQLHDRLDELTRLYAISEGLNEFLDTSALFDRVAQLAHEVTQAQRVSVMVLDRDRRYLRIRSALGVPEDVIAVASLRVGEGIAGRVVETGRSIRVAEWLGASSAETVPHAERGYTTHSWMSLPLRIGQEIFGVINVTDKLDGSVFTRQDEQLMQTLSEKAGSKLENQALYEGIYSNLVDTLTSLVTTLEAKDPYTRKHSQRVTDYAMALGRHLGLSADQLEMLNFAGMLHDIGKIGVKDGILTKTGRLTDEEYTHIKQHPIIGERIIEPLGLAPEERSIIRHHHERHDGRGYPDGLAGEQIPLLARVLAITDAFDAMTTTRSYRQAMSFSAALAEMKRCAGTQFDPVLTAVWLDAIEQGIIGLDQPASCA